MDAESNELTARFLADVKQASEYLFVVDVDGQPAVALAGAFGTSSVVLVEKGRDIDSAAWRLIGAGWRPGDGPERAAELLTVNRTKTTHATSGATDHAEHRPDH